jgi:hypothetical protein
MFWSIVPESPGGIEAAGTVAVPTPMLLEMELSLNRWTPQSPFDGVF